jgi:hypothetical protein
MTKRQREVLSFLAMCDHATSRAIGRAVPPTPTQSLLALERRGYVQSEYIGPSAVPRYRWRITRVGRAALEVQS